MDTRNTETHQKIPYTKDKEKPQTDSRKGTTVTEPNPIPARWDTHELENNSTTEVLHRSEGSKPQAGPPSLRNWQQEELLENTAFMWLDLTGLPPQDWRETKLHSWRAHTKYCMHQDPEEKKQ